MTQTPTFSDFDLADPILNNLTAHQFTQPMTIQSEVIPLALEGRDILASAPTGTGKTIAFLVPALQHLLDHPKRHSMTARVLILAPTRELVEQIAEQTQKLTATTSLTTITITGGVPYDVHEQALSQPHDILIATTGRLLYYLRKNQLNLEGVEILVLDEADRMLDMGFKTDVETLVHEAQWRQQTMLFSATLEGNGVLDFATRILNDPIEVHADASRRERKKINQYYYRADDYTHKINLLLALLTQEEMTRTIVFVKKRERVHELVGILQKHGLTACFLEGEMTQDRRADALKRLKEGKATILIATDVASRGLDIDDVSHVINFDLPRNADVYLHRIGRTARAGKKGTAIALVEAHDYLLIGKMERYTKDILRMRVIDELRPKTKAPKVKAKSKSKAKAKAEKEKKNVSKKAKARIKKKRKNSGK